MTEIINGDCLAYMQTLPDDYFDFGFADPPYNVGKDYGTYKDDLPEGEYFEWSKLWVNEFKRVCKRIAIYPPKKHLLYFWNLVPEQHQIICAWSPMGAIRSNFIHQYIPLLVPQKPIKKIKDHWWNVQVPGMGYFYREEKTGHPGQTSKDITARVLSAFVNVGESVFDPFCGSGTTGIICAEYGFNFTGCELDPGWHRYAKDKIETAYKQIIIKVD